MDAGPLNMVRPEVPVELASVVAKMMAKEPGRRFPTPGEVARALTPFFKRTGAQAAISSVEMSRLNSQVRTTGATGVSVPPTEAFTAALARAHSQPPPSKTGSTGADRENLIEGKASETSLSRAKPNSVPVGGPVPRPPWLLATTIAASALILGLGVVLYVATNNGRIKIEVNDQNADVKVDGDAVSIDSLGEPIMLRASDHVLTIKWSNGEVRTRKFVVKRGNNDALRIEYEPFVAGLAEDNNDRWRY